MRSKRRGRPGSNESRLCSILPTAPAGRSMSCTRTKARQQPPPPPSRPPFSLAFPGLQGGGRVQCRRGCIIRCMGLPPVLRCNFAAL